MNHKEFSSRGGKATQEKLRADPQKQYEHLQKMYEGRMNKSEETKRKEKEKRSKSMTEYWRKVKAGEIER